ncbi:FAD-binding protein [Cystobacter fuscus]|nr:FAD-binding protein [Cystobacter fuscus]
MMSEKTRTSLVRDLQRLLEGEVTEEPEVLERYSQDFGRTVRRMPAALARPRDAEEVARIVRYAHARDLPVASRAMGHSMRGQSLCEGGIVIDMRALRGLEEISPDARTFVSQPGVLWREVVAASTAHGLTPPVLTSYPHASVGGTLSACGWGTASVRYGAQLDHCVELEVVIGTGEHLRCNREQEPELFDHVRGGMGQFGLMTKIRYQLRRYHSTVRTYVLEYDDLGAWLEDSRTLVVRDEADHLDCALQQKPDGQGVRWTGVITASLEREAPEDRDGQRLLAGLRFARHISTQDVPTAAFVSQASNPEKPPLPGEAYPWMVTFMPWSRVQPFLELCIRRIPPAALGSANGPMRLWPAFRRVTQVPMLQMPREEIMAMLSICPATTQEGLPIMMSVMSKLSDVGMEVGARRHLGTWVHFDRARWRMHFGEAWPTINRLKRTYDPKGILNPGFIDFEPESALAS